MAKSHILGFPRIGADRELKKAIESYWKGDITKTELESVGKTLRSKHWQQQIDAGLDFITVGDFAWYDQVLALSATLGVIPARHQEETITLDTLFNMARGSSPCCGQQAAACEMTKWFDTNYHYLVPELNEDQQFALSYNQLIEEIQEAKALGFPIKATLLGPLSYLSLSKTNSDFDKLALLPQLVTTYKQLLANIAAEGIEWLQIEEPILVQDLTSDWKKAFTTSYAELSQGTNKLLLTSYFGALGDNAELTFSLPVNGFHIDLSRAPQQLETALALLPADAILSAGIVNGRNIWRNDLATSVSSLQQAKTQLGERLWIASSCSLQHSPVDLDNETKLDAELKSWLAYATQKLTEISSINAVLSGINSEALATQFERSTAVVSSRATSTRIHNAAVKARVAAITDQDAQRHSEFTKRIVSQQQELNLPLFPTTTIGSFPQTSDIRQTRNQFKQNVISQDQYITKMQAEIKDVVTRQEALGLDVLVHGEPERNDMVEYFGELLDGFAFSKNGWVQSYGTRCVKPPIIFGDISRPAPMTVAWSKYAQAQTSKLMKGMLTGPVTILCWSFTRDDISREEQTNQIALAIRDEVVDLEQAGIKVIQIDEPALREGLPLRSSEQQAYLDWSTKAFRISASGVRDNTQIHTHMCYCEFNEIMPSIAALDADVITIETSRSNMELLSAFTDFSYPNDIGPGVYDIHSPNVPSVEWMTQLITNASEYIDVARLWVNPDCGLKTRGWQETEAALQNMVTAAHNLRDTFSHKA
ncbi:5-methyltetrahydropteroyltriglutamate--homocysteine S-methyltransferase [Moritella sp. F3]|uniref:5-methyltetrahydropteroyltriglutamate-- homocysteine S-methyltransferase n=1 Tax=Moritella sp. F3 TaxID=2718882 RepID=UPI0018E0D079|nr:5-methyltetrahydropteroyltriglutamate--homocysteine S-methyltransferase [Moritella sp. F3]GIC79422.1 5-methyltetrahydropteroyltriglutamate--homocysteine methyltransferase [Moritella sp. F1]GIC81218.1 5-methyltetrahydropteroyltriglutamate--homocysteine methyltransferase [Moritella sp. F3]